MEQKRAAFTCLSKESRTISQLFSDPVLKTIFKPVILISNLQYKVRVSDPFSDSGTYELSCQECPEHTEGGQNNGNTKKLRYGFFMLAKLKELQLAS
jgi:hypothetical protein